MTITSLRARRFYRRLHREGSAGRRQDRLQPVTPSVEIGMASGPGIGYTDSRTGFE